MSRTYYCEEATVEVTCEGQTLRVWFDRREGLFSLGKEKEIAAAVRAIFFDEYPAIRMDHLIDRVIRNFSDVNAAQVIVELAGGIKRGYMVYTKPFDEFNENVVQVSGDKPFITLPVHMPKV